MKKIICLLCIITIFMTACSKQPEEPETEPVNELVDEIIFENDVYAYERINGQCYVRLKSPDDIVALEGNGREEIRFTSVIRFAEVMSKEGLKDWFVKVLRTNHAPDEDGRIKVCDVENLCLPLVPTEIKVGGLIFDGETYYFNLSSDEKLDGTFEVLTKEEYERRKRAFDMEIASDKALAEKHTTLGTSRQKIVFDIKGKNNIDLTVEEDHSERKGYASRVSIYAEADGLFFCVSLWDLKKAYQRDWYSSFGIATASLLK